MDQSLPSQPLSGKRITSLDAFRGFIMLTMLMGTFGLNELAEKNFIIVFIFNQLNHAPWVGFHFEDIILPSFLFIIGVSMGLSDVRRQARGETYKTRFIHAVKRAVIIFCFGFFLLSWMGSGRMRLGPGVLQELALSYFVAYFFLRDNIKFQFSAFFGLLFIYWLIIFIWFHPEAGRNSYIVFKNIVYYIDDIVTGEASRWGYIYPTITMAATVVYGSIVGRLLAKRKSDREFMKTLAIYGIIGIVSGLAFHPLIPIIKRMFTSSYTLFACGIDSLLLLGFFWLIDIKGISKWSFPFIVIGMNSIFIYMLHNMLGGWIFSSTGVFINHLQGLIGTWVSPLNHFARLAVEWYVVYWLYRRKIFFKI